LKSVVEGNSISEDFRTKSPFCDHCGLKRDRKFTYIVQSEDKSLKQIGRACVKDFTGGKSPDELAFQAEMIAEFDGLMMERELRPSKNGIETLTFLSYAIMVVESTGFY